MYSCIDFFNESIHAETRSATPFHIYPVESLSSPCLTKNKSNLKAVLYMLFQPIEQQLLSLFNSLVLPVSSGLAAQVR